MKMENKMKKQALSAALLCLTCVMLAVLLSSLLCPERETVGYPFDKNLASYNPYEQQLDAFLKGQLHIDIVPSKKLAELDNPYDPAQRDGIYYLWDRAYYDGKYFSYFGIGPIIAVYYPHYLLTGTLPADDTVSAIFTVMTALFFSLAVIKLWAMLGKRTPMWLLWILTIGGLAATQVFLVMRGDTRFYYIATVSGMAFLSAFAWLFLCGISGTVRLDRRDDIPERSWHRPLIYLFAGLSYGLCFLCRFNMAVLAAFIIAPMLWLCIVRDKNGFRDKKKLARELLALALPVILAVGVQLILNYARFDSLFEFGTSYQLTVSDVSKNRLRLGDIGYTVYHYFLQPLSFAEDFPLAALLYSRLEDYGRYVYVDTGMGLFSIPFMWMLFGSVFVFADKRQSVGRKIILSSALFGILFVAWLDFCLGGVIFRYTCDLTVVGALVSIASVFMISESISPSEDGATVRRGASAVLLFIVAVSLFVSLTLAFSKNVNLTEYPEWVYNAFRALFFK